MSHEGVTLIIRTGLVLLLILSAAFFRALAGPSKKRGEVMVLGTLGGISAGVLIAYLISPWLGFDVSALCGSIGMLLGVALSWLFAKRIPRETD
jgi:predicted membrane-bound spermidine synthase